jgi:uncharacterized repeat protein (TIGR01451 family)
MFNFYQQNYKIEPSEKTFNPKGSRVIFIQLIRNIVSIFINKCHFLSLVSGKDVFTFVSYSNSRMNHLPMSKTNPTVQAAARRKRLAKVILFLAGLAFCAPALQAQGWEIYFGGANEDIGQSVIQASDHGYVATGFSESFGPDGDLDVYAIRTDVDGKEIWSNYYDEGWTEHGYSIIETPDGGFLIAGDIFTTPLAPSNVYLLKINAHGKKVWSKQYGGGGNDLGFRIIPAENSGGYLIVGRTASFGNGGDDVLLVKVDDNGNQVWSQAYGTPGDDFGRGVIELSDGYLITGSAFNQANSSTDLYLLKVDFAGNEQWTKFFGTNDIDEGYDLTETSDGNIALVGYTGSNSDVYLLKVNAAGGEIWANTYGGVLGDQGLDILQTKGGDLVVAGVTETDFTNSDAFLAKFDNDGNQVWWNNVGRGSHIDGGQAVAETADEGFIVVGYNSLFGTFINDVTLIKTGPTGAVYTNHLTGKVFNDDEDCVLQTGEPGLNDWIVKAASPGKTFFGTTDTNGFYDITVDTGSYTVSVLVKNDYWEPCVAAYNVNFNTFYDTLIRNFPILPLVDCPLLEVDVSAPVVQNCSNIGYVVSYCNSGTVMADTPSVSIILDEALTMTGSSIPWAFNQDSLYVFNLDTLGLDECGSFSFTASSDCNGIPAQAYNVIAHIFPDSICLPPSPGWDFASVDVGGYCDIVNDSVRFTLINEGTGNMQQPLNFIVIEDDIMGFQGSFQLEAGMEKLISRVADGTTYRIIAEQSPGHPGNNYPTVAIEGCTTESTFSTGYTTMFHENDNDPFVNIDVQEAISSTDYILLRGYPKGYFNGGENLIPANTDVEYHIFFQNAGTDTVTRLVIRDTLPPSLDLATVVAGTSSHPYDFEVYGNGVLKFTLDNILLLPDGSADSQGFIKFKVSQKPDNPGGTLIPNSAAVFLGFDAPAQTATYTHTVCPVFVDCLIVTDTDEPLLPGVEINAYPNPFASAIVFETKGVPFQTLKIYVFDMKGQLVCSQQSAGNRLSLPRNGLAAGTYTYRLEADGKLLNTGKIIAQ